MAKKQTIIKKPGGNGNISITIENNLKNTNIAQPVVKKRKKRNKAPTEAVNLPPPPQPPLKDVSYIKPPSDRFTVWRDNLDDSFNTTIPQGQAQQMGLLRSIATPALTNQQQSQPQPQPQPQPIIRAPQAIYDPLGIPDDESSAISTQSSSSAPSISSSMTSLPNYTRFVPDNSSMSSYVTAPSISSYATLSRVPSTAPSTSSLPSSVTSDFVREMRELLTGSGIGRGNDYDNLQYDPYGNESIEDRFSDSSSIAGYYTPLPPDRERSHAPSLSGYYTPSQASSLVDQEHSPTPPLPAQEHSPTPPLPARRQSKKPFAVDVYEELAADNPGISVDEAGQILAADKDATQNDIEEFSKGKQSIITTAKTMGRKHGRSGKQMQGRYFHMQEYIDSYLTGRGESDAKKFMTMDPDMLSIDAEDFYKNIFNRIKNSVTKGTEKRQTRAETKAKSRIEDVEAGSREF